MSDVDTTRERCQCKPFARGIISTMGCPLHSSDSTVNKVSMSQIQKKGYVQAFDDLLEAMPEKRTRIKDLDGIIKHELFQFDDNPRMQKLIGIGKINGFNTCHDLVIATIHQLKSSKKGADDE